MNDQIWIKSLEPTDKVSLIWRKKFLWPHRKICEVLPKREREGEREREWERERESRENRNHYRLLLPDHSHRGELQLSGEWLIIALRLLVETWEQFNLFWQILVRWIKFASDESTASGQKKSLISRHFCQVVIDLLRLPPEEFFGKGRVPAFQQSDQPLWSLGVGRFLRYVAAKVSEYWRRENFVKNFSFPISFSEFENFDFYLCV